MLNFGHIMKRITLHLLLFLHLFTHIDKITILSPLWIDLDLKFQDLKLKSPLNFDQKFDLTKCTVNDVSYLVRGFYYVLQIRSQCSMAFVKLKHVLQLPIFKENYESTFYT